MSASAPLATSGESRPAEWVIVALGSNLGDPVANLRAALAQLRSLTAGPWLASSLWRTSPVDCPPGSPPFINAVVAFHARRGETPETLLAKLQALEHEFGRQPKQILNEARPLDLDLIAFGAEARTTPGLTLPHPRAPLRRFVLAPLAEILPDLVLGGQTRSVAALLAELATDETLERLAAGAEAV